jgi:hypothetical protein
MNEHTLCGVGIQPLVRGNENGSAMCVKSPERSQLIAKI